MSPQALPRNPKSSPTSIVHPRRFVGLALLAAAALLCGPGSAQSAGWMDPGWSQRQLLTVAPDSLAGSESLGAFPLLVRLSGTTGSEIFANAKADGSDLRFTAIDGTTLLPHEVVSYDSGAGTAELWVRFDGLSSTNHELYLYWGNPAASAVDGSSVWSDYEAVYHYEDDPSQGTLTDSSPKNADADVWEDGSEWTAQELVDGYVGKGWHYGLYRTVHTKKISIAETSWSVGAWLYHDNHGTDFFLQTQPCYFFLASQASDVSHSVQYRSSYCGGDMQWRWVTNAVPVGEWHHYQWVYDGPQQQMLFYYDGVAQSPVAWPEGAVPYDSHQINPDGTEFVGIIGPMWSNGMDDMNGVGDEFRIRKGVVSPERILTEVRNERSPDGFVSFGAVEVSNAERTSVGRLKASFSGGTAKKH